MPRAHKIVRLPHFGLMAHIDAGKTTTTDADPLLPGKSPKRSVTSTMSGHHGLDGSGAGARHHHHLGRETASWPSMRLNIIDTPGHVDFTSRLSVLCVCSTARWPCSTSTRALSRRPRRSCASRRYTSPARVRQHMDKSSRLDMCRAHHPRALGVKAVRSTPIGSEDLAEGHRRPGPH